MGKKIQAAAYNGAHMVYESRICFSEKNFFYVQNVISLLASKKVGFFSENF
jgi:hypothetical protein